MMCVLSKSLCMLLGIICISINSKYQDTTEISYTDFKMGCMVLGKLEPSYIINSHEEYEILLNCLNPNPNCQNYNLPYIDFNRYTLLGFFTADSGCNEPEYTKSVKLIESEKTYTYTIDVITTGLCRALFQKGNFILIPKIKSEYNVTFKKNLINKKQEFNE